MVTKKTHSLPLVLASISALACSAAMADDATKNGGFKMKGSDTEFKIGARLMFDFDYFDGVHGDGSDTELRRGRFYLQSKNGPWKMKLQINIDDDGTSGDKFEDAYLENSSFDFGSIKIGKFKEPFGLEWQISSKYITTIERTSVTNAFSPGRSYGVALSGGTKNRSWTFGYFDNGNDVVSGSQRAAFTGRYTYAPVMEDNNLLHIGLAYSHRDYSGDVFAISERAEVHLANRILNSPDINTDKLDLFGLETAYVAGPLSVQAEYQMASASSTDNADGEFSGYYVQGSYFLTGESRPYKKGRFGLVKPSEASGAWELVLSYSFLDASDLDQGTEGTNIVLGANYYASNNVRFMFNLINTSVDTIAGATTTSDDGDAVAIRGQYIF